jgi:gamma-glutamyl phosphate reductase
LHVVLAERPTHEETQAFMEDRSSVDLLIPRGGKKLIQAVVQHAKVPVIETGAGVCHVYVDEGCRPEKMASQIILNAKMLHVHRYAMPWRHCLSMPTSPKVSCQKYARP